MRLFCTFHFIQMSSADAPEAPPPPTMAAARPVAKAAGKSFVWQYFTDPTVATTGKHLGKSTTTCTVPVNNAPCGHVLLYQHSTTSLSNHLNLVHSAYMGKVFLVLCSTHSPTTYFCSGEGRGQDSRTGTGDAGKCSYSLEQV